jgi:hypothetical protein
MLLTHTPIFLSVYVIKHYLQSMLHSSFKVMNCSP